MKKFISVFIVICMLFTTIFSSSIAVFGANNDIDFETAEPINSNIVYEESVESGGYVLSSFTAPEDGYYLFEVLGDKHKVGEFFIKQYKYDEPVATLYDSEKNELQYVEFDAYDPSIVNNAPYAKMVQKMKKGEVYYFKTNLLNPEKSGTYFIRVMKAPDLVFTFLSEDEFIGYYELYRYTGSLKELTLNNYYTIDKADSLYNPMDDVVFNSIGLGAFEGNEFLEDITLPYDFSFISSEAFLNCKSLKTVNLSRNIEIIGYRAFAGCESLKSITIQSYDVTLEPQCLGYDENGDKYSDFKIICNEDSTAEEYAKANGIDYTIIGREPIPPDNTDSSDNTGSTSGSDITDSSNSNVDKKPVQNATISNQNTSASIYSVSPSKINKVVKPKVKEAKIKKVTKTSKKRQLKVKWKKISGVSGYEIKCGLNRKMKKGKKVVYVKANRNSKIIKGLKSKKTYYIKLRAYKTYKSENGEIRKSYGEWSKIIKKKTG